MVVSFTMCARQFFFKFYLCFCMPVIMEHCKPFAQSGSVPTAVPPDVRGVSDEVTVGRR